MSIYRKVNELDLAKLNLSKDAYRVVKDIEPEKLVGLVRTNRTAELFRDEEGLPLYCCHWEKLEFVRLEIERKLAEAGFVDLDKNRAYRTT